MPPLYIDFLRNGQNVAGISAGLRFVVELFVGTFPLIPWITRQRVDEIAAARLA